MNKSISSKEISTFTEVPKYDPDFKRFIRIHPDITCPFSYWYVARNHPYMLDKCIKASKVIAHPPQDDNILCEHCGRFFQDAAYHYITQCSSTNEHRDRFWDKIHNSMSVELAAYLLNIEDHQLVVIILGAPCDLL